MWLVEHRIGVVVAVWILVADPTSLTHGRIWVDTKAVGGTWHLTWLLPIASLACYKKDSFVEATNHWDLGLGLLLLLLLLLLLSLLVALLSGLGWLLR
jgi:hypothetical protein